MTTRPTAYRDQTLVTNTPVRGRLTGATGTPTLSFVPFLEGVHDIQVTGTADEQATWLEATAETIASLAVQVRRREAKRLQDAALATYPEASGGNFVLGRVASQGVA